MKPPPPPEYINNGPAAEWHYQQCIQISMNFVAKVKNLLSYKRKARVDNVVSTLHKVTAGVLLSLSVLVSSGVYVKKPITCMGDKVIKHAVDAYCWIHSTYTVPNRTNENFEDVLAAHPGVGPEYPEDEIRVHKYYQWVCFVLFFQAIAFYIPRIYWKQNEGKRIFTLSSVGFDDFKRSESSVVKRRKQCVDYFVNAMGYNEGWAFKFIICEILNFVNVIIQIDLTDRFVGRALSKYGFTILQFASQNPLTRTDPMALAFPTMTKCTFQTFGPTGNIIRFDNLCVLPLNIYNEKFYPIIWLWFIILAAISGLALVYRLGTYLLPELRHELMKRRFAVAKIQPDMLHKINRKLDYGDWFLLYQIGKNMRPSAFCDFVDELAGKLSEESIFKNSLKEKEKFH